MPFILGKRSIQRLQGVHPDLVKVITYAITITEIDFTVLEGVRALARQKQLYKAGATRTLNSRHLPVRVKGINEPVAHAVDLGVYVNGKIAWDWPLYYKIAKAVKKAANDLKIPIEWGGDWKSFKDGPHFQLPFKEYPKC